MKLIIDESLEYQDVEITIKCPIMDGKLKRLVSQIRLNLFSITGKKDGASFQIQLEDIFYFESVNDTTFIYCEKEIFECDRKLYELENELSNSSFVRVSKSSILNTSHIFCVKALINGKFEAKLNNEERIIINRHYVQAFKEKLNIK